MTTSSKPNPRDVFLAIKQAIRDELEEMHKAITDDLDNAPENVDWHQVSELSHLEDLITDVLERHNKLLHQRIEEDA